MNTIKARWEEDLGEELTEEVWDAILLRVHGSSICARHTLIQFKLLNHIYYTKARLSKIYDNVSAECDRCHQSPSDLMHTVHSGFVLPYTVTRQRSSALFLECSISPGNLAHFGPKSLTNCKSISFTIHNFYEVSRITY